MRQYEVKVTTQDGERLSRKFTSKANARQFYDSLRETTQDNIKLVHTAMLVENGIGMSAFCNLNKVNATGYLYDLIGDMRKNKRWDNFGHIIYEDFARESAHWLTPTMWTTLLETWLAFGMGETVRDGNERCFVPYNEYCLK